MAKSRVNNVSVDMKLPEPIAAAVAPLFKKLPLAGAMQQLVVTQGGEGLVPLVETITHDAAIRCNVGLIAGLWLYVDELDRSHTVSQSDDTATGSYWHGIMHRREGDFSNSHYWFRSASDHPALAQLNGYDGHAFIDAVEAGYRNGDAASLIKMQQQEWANLFQWCATHGT